MYNKEERELCQAVDAFANAMKAKLLDKCHTGWSGWRAKRFITRQGRFRGTPTNSCRGKLLSHAERLLLGDPQEVDIANLAMFSWAYRQRERANEYKEHKDG